VQNKFPAQGKEKLSTGGECKQTPLVWRSSGGRGGSRGQSREGNEGQKPSPGTSDRSPFTARLFCVKLKSIQTFAVWSLVSAFGLITILEIQQISNLLRIQRAINKPYRVALTFASELPPPGSHQPLRQMFCFLDSTRFLWCYTDRDASN